MSSFGHQLAQRRNRRYEGWRRWSRNLHALCVGTGDLHGLVRCPPLANRLERTAACICDVGCGSGQFHLEALLSAGSGKKVVGLDPDLQALRCARQAAEDSGLSMKVCYVCGSAERLPFRDGVFDQLFLVDVLEHVRNDAASLHEGHRVLKEAGRLEVSTPTPLYPKVFGGRIHRSVGHVRAGYSSQTLAQHLRAAGFEILHASQNTGYLLWLPMALWYRIGWGLWNPGPKGPWVKGFYHSVLVLLALWVHAARPFDFLGGYCSNDVQAEKKRLCPIP